MLINHLMLELSKLKQISVHLRMGTKFIWHSLGLY